MRRGLPVGVEAYEHAREGTTGSDAVGDYDDYNTDVSPSGFLGSVYVS